MKKLTFLLLFLLTTVVSFAYDFEVNGIYYNKLSDNTCEVTYRNTNGNSYSGAIVIEKEVTYQGSTFSVVAIGKDAFWECYTLTSVVIPNSVKTIGKSAFYDCHSLTSLTIPNSVISIDQYAFDGCSYIVSVTIPNSVTTIGSSAFSGCRNLKSVHIDSIESWCSIEFANTSANPLSNKSMLILNNEPVSTLVIPNTVTRINNAAFYNCPSLISVTIPSSVTTIGNNAFNCCTSLTSLNLSNSLETIGDGAFVGCSGLTTVDIPNSVTSIGDGAFSSCINLTSVTIPSSVTNIGGDAFYVCTNLSDVTVLHTTPLELSDYVFTGTNPQKRLHVYKGYKDVYARANVWKSFSQILDDVPLPEKPNPKCATPVISLVDREIIATCETEGAQCHVIAQTNANTAAGTNIVIPSAILTVTAYATAEGYEKSETATREFNLMELQGEGGVRGDTNGDGQVTVTDIVKTAGYILTGEWGE